jgi:ubiquinol-cytochrome c reductase cytochrome c subunit
MGRSPRRARGPLPVVLGATALALALQVGLASSGGAQDPEIVRGGELYESSCLSCHGPAGSGSEQGPPLVGVGAAAVDFMLSTGRMPIGDPNARPVRQPPAFDRAEIDALVAYVGSLRPGGPDIPVVDPVTGDVADGRAIFAANCLACHGAGGQGASVGGGAIAPSVLRATEREIAEAVRIGPGAMPPFGELTVTDEDLASLLRYVQELRDAPHPGGVDLGRVGPVVEGFVAWLVGLGALVIAIRLTGTRT